MVPAGPVTYQHNSEISTGSYINNDPVELTHCQSTSTDPVYSALRTDVMCSVVTKSHTSLLWLLLTLINREEGDSHLIQHSPEVTFNTLLQLGLQSCKANANELWIWITMTGEINYHKLNASILVIWVIMFCCSLFNLYQGYNPFADDIGADCYLIIGLLKTCHLVFTHKALSFNYPENIQQPF